MAEPTRTPLTLSTPTGVIDAAVHVLAITDDTITVEFDVAATVHDQALASGWFHLGPLTAGPGAGTFGPDSDVRIEARLDPRLVAGLRQVVATADAVVELLVALGPTSDLCSQASWFACAATREVPVDDEMVELLGDALAEGSLREGYRTAWGIGDGGGLPIVAHLAAVIERRFHDAEALVDHQGFRWSLTGADASWVTTAIVDAEVGWCVLYSVLDADFSGADRDVLIERTGQLSAGLLFGSWHITDGPLAVRFRSSIELPDRIGAPALLDQLITRHLDIVDEYAGVFATP